MESVIEVNGLTKLYNRVKVVDNLSISIKKGDVYGFLGPNGAGKTTTIRMMLGLIALDSGSVYINGKNIKNDYKDFISNIGAIVETPTFYGYLSAYDNLQLIANLTPGIKKNRVEEVIEIVGLKGRERDKVKTYSLGMKQRLGIAQALLPNPSLLILDEPTNGLDPHGMKEIRDMIKRLAEDHGYTFIISSHILHDIQQICNRVCIIKNGKLVKEEYVENLLAQKAEIVEIQTLDKKLAIDLLMNSASVSMLEEIEKGILITIESGMLEVIIEDLILNHIRVKYVLPKENSLEELFFELTGGKEE